MRLMLCRMTTAAMTTPLGREPVDDADVMQRIARGDGGALEQLVRRYQPQVARLTNRLLGWDGDVDDIVQDVFLAVLEKSHAFRGEASVWSWLTTITLNRCRSHARRRLVKSRVWSLLGRTNRSAAGACHQAMGDEVTRTVRSAVAALPPRDREIVVLVYLENRPVAEVAELLGASRNAIDVRLHRARAKLRERLRSFVEE